MGCDIHIFFERKTSDDNYDGPKDIKLERDKKIGTIIDGEKPQERWVSADKWHFSDGMWEIDWKNSIYTSGRNYYLFGVLSGVRNPGVKPISDPKGIPKDASSAYKWEVDCWTHDGHSHSYFTLDELLKVKWSKYDREEISEFLETIEKMKKIDPDPKKVRCCFFFDN